MTLAKVEKRYEFTIDIVLHSEVSDKNKQNISGQIQKTDYVIT